MTARDRFAELVGAPVVPLAAACFAMSAHLGHPMSEADGLAELDALAGEVGARAVSVGTVVDLDLVATHLFATVGFAGDRADYYAPRNSLLPEVLRRRRGIPITLAVVVIEVAARVGVPAVGVGMPGHFLVGDGTPPGRWLDGFDGGRWLDRREAESRFLSLHGAATPFDPAYLGATPPRQVVARIVTNMVGAQRRLGDPTGVLRALELRDAIPGVGAAPAARAELAAALEAVGRRAEAAAVLEELLATVDPRARERVQARLAAVRATLN